MPHNLILVVDDNVMNLKLFEVVLRGAGYTVKTATNAEEARAAVARCCPDLILLDIQLPDTDGLTLARALKADEATRSACIVAITAFATAEQRERAYAAGCDGFTTKPIDTRVFPETIAGYLTSRSA